MRRLVKLIEPVAGVGLFLWWLFTAAQPIISEVPVRTETDITNPYPIAIAGAFAAAVAISRLSPRFAVGIAGLAVVTQVIGWAGRFSNTGWTAYAILLVLAAALGFHSRGRTRTVAIAVAVPTALVVSGLLNLPGLSPSGQWGLINGKPEASPDIWTGFAIWAVVALGIATLLWRAATRLRNRLTASADPSPARNALTALSQRERDIYLWVARGMTNAEIAATAHIEESTVKSHVTSILSKLELTSRAGIVAHAYRTGTLVPEPAVTP